MDEPIGGLLVELSLHDQTLQGLFAIAHGKVEGTRPVGIYASKTPFVIHALMGLVGKYEFAGFAQERGKRVGTVVGPARGAFHERSEMKTTAKPAAGSVVG